MSLSYAPMFTPTEAKVLIKHTPPEKIGGVLMPIATGMDLQQGEVVRVGPGRLTDSGVRIPLQCQPGDKVLFAIGMCSKIKIENGQELFLGQESVIMGIADAK